MGGPFRCLGCTLHDQIVHLRVHLSCCSGCCNMNTLKCITQASGYFASAVTMTLALQLLPVAFCSIWHNRSTQTA